MTIDVLYTCKGCGLDKVKVPVPTRGDEDVVKWMESTMRLLAVEHRRRSPRCFAERLDLMVPTTGRGDRLGGPMQH